MSKQKYLLFIFNYLAGQEKKHHNCSLEKKESHVRKNTSIKRDI